MKEKNNIYLFDRFDRDDLSLAHTNENLFSYINRSSRKDFALCRETLNNWFSQYPNDHKKELKSQFTIAFDAAFYELFLHELFRKQGFSLTVHPEILGCSKRPDFLVQGKGIAFYVEDTISKDMSEEEESKMIRLKVLEQYLNDCLTDNLFLSVCINQENIKANVKKKQVESFVQKCIQEYKETGNSGPFTYPHPEVDFEIRLIESSENMNDKRSVGTISFSEGKIFGAGISIKSSISKKAKKYQNLDKPLLICVNSMSAYFYYSIDIPTIFFGNKNLENDGYKSETINWNKSVFGTEQNAKNTKMSSVLISKIHPLNLVNPSYALMNHPWGKFNLELEKLGLSYYKTEGLISKFIEKKILTDNDSFNQPYFSHKFNEMIKFKS